MHAIIGTLNWTTAFNTSGQLRAGLFISLLSVWMLVGVFSYLNYYTRRRYFSIWMVAWLFYAIYLTLSYGLFWHYDSFKGEPWWGTMFKQWAIGVAAVFMLWGSLCFLGKTVRQLSLGLFIIFLFVWSLIADYPWPNGFFLRQVDRLILQLPIFALIGFASLVTVWGFFQYRRRRQHLGAGLLCFGFLLWGLFVAAYPFLETLSDYMSTAFFSASVLQMFIAVNMIILVLEQIRHLHEKRAAQQLKYKEQEKNLLQHRIILTEERYRHLFEQSHEPIVITTQDDFRIVGLNPAAARVLGLSQETARDYCLTDRFVPSKAEQESLPNGQARFEALCRQRYHQLQSKDGSVVHVEVAGSGIDFAGETAFQFYLREVTDRSRLEQQLRQAEKLSGLGQMVSSVAHELNSPLTVCSGFIELALMDPNLPPAMRERLGKAAAESQRAARLLRNFLNLARDGGSEKQTTFINDILRNLAELRQGDLKRTQTELDLKLDPQLPPIVANTDQLQQIVIILFNNALQALEASKDDRKIRLATRRQPDGVAITVEDSGPGVPPHLRARVFEPFFTTKPAGIGTGLGLSIAYTLVSEHHGRIFCGESNLGGALFAVELPWVESPAAKAAPKQPMTVSSLPQFPSPSPALA